ncbi:MAG: TetR family transcriptional regulator [Acidimicrobiia bacterium]|nr:TetR family transcriptional regulator [Acidimicrobiia bacterium]
MTLDTSEEQAARAPLSPGRIARAAVALADEEAMEAVTMRGVAQRLSVEAMSLYHHVKNKEALLNGMVDVIVEEITAELDSMDAIEDWKERLRTRILTARRVMLRHPWAPPMIETRTAMSPHLLRYFDAVLGTMLEGGFSYDLAHHAMHALGSRALGFNQELFAPDDSAPDDGGSVSVSEMAEQVPNLVAMLTEVVHDDPDSTLGWCDDQTEFEFGLDLLLDGLERRASI